MSHAGLTRRRFLRRTIGFGGATLLLAACGPTTPQASAPAPTPPRAAAPTPVAISQPTASAAGAPSAAAVKFQGVVLPTYIPSANGPTPDLPSTDPNVDPGFNNFPKNSPKATQNKPGKGGDVTFFVGAYYPPATPME